MLAQRSPVVVLDLANRLRILRGEGDTLKTRRQPRQRMRPSDDGITLIDYRIRRVITNSNTVGRGTTVVAVPPCATMDFGSTNSSRTPAIASRRIAARPGSNAVPRTRTPSFSTITSTASRDRPRRGVIPPAPSPPGKPTKRSAFFPGPVALRLGVPELEMEPELP
jgi:hypothetical protein